MNTFKVRDTANKVFALAVRAERISMLLHWPLFWLSRAMHAFVNFLDAQQNQLIARKRDRRSIKK